jgi:phosphotriesterase-related protein
MSNVQTVRGAIDTKRLGVTLMHEHLNFRTFPCNVPEKFLEKNRLYQHRLIKDALDVGVNTLVDCGPFPDVPEIIKLSDAFPQLNIILSTGAYVEGGVPEPIKSYTEDEMVRHMVRNITKGYEGHEKTGLKAGIIKVAGNKSQLTDWEKKNFRAVARAQQECGVPIVTHACAGSREQMEYLREHGARIDATFYSHVEAKFGWDGRSREEEAEYLCDVARAGGYLQFNNFDFAWDTPFADLVFLMNHLEDKGFGSHIFFSIDVNWIVDENGTVWHEAEREHPEAGKRTYAYAITHAAPMLMAAGVSLQRIWKYLVDNPRRFFEVLAK